MDEETYARAELDQFLSYIGDKGLVNAGTAKGWKVAVSQILTDLSQAEEQDVRKIDIDVAFRRYMNKNPGTLAPSTLTEYRRRIPTAVQEFLAWKADPVGYKPRGLGKPVRNSNGGGNGERPAARRTERPAATAHVTMPSQTPSGALPMPFPLRPDFLAQLVLPRDLTADEAKRLSAFITALVVDFKPAAEPPVQEPYGTVKARS